MCNVHHNVGAAAACGHTSGAWCRVRRGDRTAPEGARHAILPRHVGRLQQRGGPGPVGHDVDGNEAGFDGAAGAVELLTGRTCAAKPAVTRTSGCSVARYRTGAVHLREHRNGSGKVAAAKRATSLTVVACPSGQQHGSLSQLVQGHWQRWRTSQPHL